MNVHARGRKRKRKRKKQMDRGFGEGEEVKDKELKGEIWEVTNGEQEIGRQGASANKWQSGWRGGRRRRKKKKKERGEAKKDQ